MVEFAHQLSVFRPVDCVDTSSLRFVIPDSGSAAAVTGVLSVSDGRVSEQGSDSSSLAADSLGITEIAGRALAWADI